MADFIEAKTGNGAAVLLEVTNAATVGPERVTRRGDTVIGSLDERLDEALATVRPAAENVLNTFTGLGLETVEIEFGLSLDAQAGAFIAKTGVTGHFKVTLTWNAPEPSPPAA